MPVWMVFGRQLWPSFNEEPQVRVSKWQKNESSQIKDVVSSEQGAPIPPPISTQVLLMHFKRCGSWQGICSQFSFTLAAVLHVWSQYKPASQISESQFSPIFLSAIQDPKAERRGRSQTLFTPQFVLNKQLCPSCTDR